MKLLVVNSLKKVKKLTKKLEPSKWATTIVTTLNNGENKVVKVEKLNVFKKGDNPAVDKLAFKQKDVEVKDLQDFPYTQVLGKVIKQPETFEDVRPQLMEDYRKFKEEEWVRSLRAKYPVNVDWNVVNTVNNH